MYVEQEDKEKVVVVMSTEEARLILETLRGQGDAVGKEGASLAAALDNVGIELPARPDYPRTEYMPPRD
ncbi:MAG: hypothetical protein B7Z66_07485 [Chromatiales bacterium 21-64-14]|nr:MAG: hypothetical protein B7Z66_07485 [Chromatiales bacterium 21-64-14]HQU15425.1 hypothetical protein [Gammaproteobacteria bacterium]